MTRATTTKIGGNADYAKVAERLRLFREANPNGKQESGYTVENGMTIFTVWLWKDKNQLLELMKSGVTDSNVLRSSSDANGTAKGETEKAKKDFEKLESIALGRALANLGYLASGEIASSEEMEEFQNYKKEKVDDAIALLKAAKTLDELKEVFMGLGDLMADKEIIKTKDEQKAELSK